MLKFDMLAINPKLHRETASALYSILHSKLSSKAENRTSDRSLPKSKGFD